MRRFTDTNKWDDQWFRSLTGPQKLVFLYVVDRCNNAGFWEKDNAAIAYHTNLSTPNIEGAWKGLARGLVEQDGWIWVRRFLKHQKNEPLNPQNPAHKQIISLIREQLLRFAQSAEFREFEGALKGLLSPIGTVQVKVQRGVGDFSAQWFPEGFRESEHFTNIWTAFLEHREQRREPLTSPSRRALLSKCSEFGLAASIDAIDLCIRKDWKNPRFPDEQTTGAAPKHREDGI